MQRASPIDWTLPSTQGPDDPHVLHLGYGHPDPALLPVQALSRASQTALANMGASALEYGANAGPGPLLAVLRDHLESIGEGDIPANELVITAGNSHALDLLVTLCTQPGDVVLVESPTYHLALRVLRDHPVTLVGAPANDGGIDVQRLAQLTHQLQQAGKHVRALYCVPTFNNPTGLSLPRAQRQALVDWAALENVLILEDDVYRELAYDAPALPSLWSLGPRQHNPVARMGSFAKTLGPGLRLGYLTASDVVIDRILASGLLDSGGGPNHFTACCVAGVFGNGDYGPQVARLRQAYRSRRDALVGALREHLPTGCSWHIPGGGFFVWVTLPPGMHSTTLLSHALASGVGFVPGTHFYSDDSDAAASRQLRLAFTLYDEVDLREAAQRLGRAVRG